MEVPAKVYRHANWSHILGNNLIILSVFLALGAALIFGIYILAGFLLPLASFLIFVQATKDIASREGTGNLNPDAALIWQEVKTTQDLFLAAYNNNGGLFVAARLAIPKTIYRDYNLQSQPLSDGYLLKARELAAEIGEAEIYASHLFGALLLLAPELKSIMFDRELEDKDILNVVYWESRERNVHLKEKQAWRTVSVKKGGGVGADWAAGATYNLQQYSHDLSLLFANGKVDVKLFGRSDEISELERALSRSSGANAILVGEEGIGKRTIVLGLAERMVSGKVAVALQYKKVIELNITSAIAGASNPREVEARLIKLLNEATRAGNVVLFIDNIAALLGQAGGENTAGVIDASEVLIPYFKNSSLQVVGTATNEGFRQIENHPALSGLFEKIDVKEPSAGDCAKIVEEVAPQIESKNRVIITYKAIIKTIELADKYIHDVPFPEKAIDLLDMAAVYVATSKAGGLVTVKDVEVVAEQKTHIKVGVASADEKNILLNMEAELHKRVIGQEEAIKAVSDALRRARSGIDRGSKPIGSFLFLGPTGVGKTETAKAMAAVYFGAETAMIRFDMSEYQEQNSIEKLIGNPGQDGLLTEAVRMQPFALLLLDELEKSHAQVRDIFLQILDDGRLTDGKGRTVDFKNTIVIATSNAGAELIRQALLKNLPAETLKKDLLDYLQRENIFRPEFLNRFDGVISFLPLTMEQVMQVIDLMIVKLEQDMAEKDIKLTLTSAAKQKLAHLGYDPVMGARPLRRVLQEKVENYLAKAMLSGEIQRGSTVWLDEGDV